MEEEAEPWLLSSPSHFGLIGSSYTSIIVVCYISYSGLYYYITFLGPVLLHYITVVCSPKLLGSVVLQYNTVVSYITFLRYVLLHKTTFSRVCTTSQSSPDLAHIVQHFLLWTKPLILCWELIGQYLVELVWATYILACHYSRYSDNSSCSDSGPAKLPC